MLPLAQTDVNLQSPFTVQIEKDKSKRLNMNQKESMRHINMFFRMIYSCWGSSDFFLHRLNLGKMKIFQTSVLMPFFVAIHISFLLYFIHVIKGMYMLYIHQHISFTCVHAKTLDGFAKQPFYLCIQVCRTKLGLW